MSYDDQNVFAKILRGEIPCSKVYEDDHALAFKDINPLAPVHVLVIPKGPYVSHHDFAEKATDGEIAGFTRAVAKVATLTGTDKTGYRTIANHGQDAFQEVPHYHIHLFGGRELRGMLKKPD